VKELKNAQFDARRSLMFHDTHLPLCNGTWKPRWSPRDAENQVQPNPWWIGRDKQKALPHFALMYRIHFRVLRAVKFRREFWQIRKWSYHPVSWRTVSIFLDLKNLRFRRYGGAPNL